MECWNNKDKKMPLQRTAEARVDTLISEEDLHVFLKALADTDTEYPWVDVERIDLGPLAA